MANGNNNGSRGSWRTAHGIPSDLGITPEFTAVDPTLEIQEIVARGQGKPEYHDPRRPVQIPGVAPKSSPIYWY